MVTWILTEEFTLLKVETVERIVINENQTGDFSIIAVTTEDEVLLLDDLSDTLAEMVMEKLATKISMATYTVKMNDLLQEAQEDSA